MGKRGGAIHVATTRRHYKGRVYEAHLLRRSYREDGKVKNETLGNISHLPGHLIEIIRRSLKGELALICARVLRPASKLESGRYLSDTSLGQDLAVSAGDPDALYGALDWLRERQDTIESTLARRHLTPGGLVLFDLSSSYLTGRHCPLAARGYSRDGRRGTLQITYGLITTSAGCPVAVEVFPGNFSDPAAFSAALA